MRETLILDRHETSALSLDYPYAHVNFVNDEETPGFSGDPNRIFEHVIHSYDYRCGVQASEPKNHGLTKCPTPDKFAEFAVWFWDALNSGKIEGFVVNCGAGASRSSGLAVFIERFLGNDDAHCFGFTTHRVTGSVRQYSPNPLVVASAIVAALMLPDRVPSKDVRQRLLAFNDMWRD